MANTAKKRSSDSPPSSKFAPKRGSRGKKTEGPFICTGLPADHEKKNTALGLNNDQMWHFQQILQKWVKTHCTDEKGDAWSHHQIADVLGVSQTEVSAWKDDKKRPGISRLIHFREVFGLSLDEMLGLPRLCRRR